MKQIYFTDDQGSFCLRQPENVSCLYFPLASEAGLKSSVTPNLGGDAKIDQKTFLMEPVSSENLHNNRCTRNFWCRTQDGCVYSAAGSSAQQEAAKFTDRQDESEVEAGFMYHILRRASKKSSLCSEITSFIPWNDTVEIMHVTIRNNGDTEKELTPYAAIPLYGRSADNIRDHRNVTSMLHRTWTEKNGVFVCPSMSFDERGHLPNRHIYYVLGCTGNGALPIAFYPTAESFIGEGGSYIHPRAVYEQYPGIPAGSRADGREAAGAFRFEKITLAPGEKTDYIILLGMKDDREKIQNVFEKYNTTDKVCAALAETKTYWQHKVNIGFHTGDADFDSLMKWIGFQPLLRRLFGCSFLPHHDYGRGGRGWRDLWQDCLSLLLMDPGHVGEMIGKNYGGVRIDGTNATIIGEGDGNFLADRNGISRVWMDHALWPLMTTRLYMDQTGDIRILTKEVPYFKDAQVCRGEDTDTLWNEDCGNDQLTSENDIYTGTILEHLLIQQLTAFYDVGEHNLYRLRGADWNDALDMAQEHGESVAFTCAYAGSLLELASMIRLLDAVCPEHSIPLLEEISVLLGQSSSLYDDIGKKREILALYTDKCRHTVSGRRVPFSLEELALDLTEKADWLITYIRNHEWISLHTGEGWFNSYYDNHGQAVEGLHGDHVRMMLTGQVFAIMGGIATKEQIGQITKSADHYLYQKEIGGYRLNTDFHELKLDMGRMFGFAYGEKENGAVFSHMTVMYANALYSRGFIREGWKALKTLADAALCFENSLIYPGIPEYFRSDGRGMYHYLTGAASWYLMTMVTQVFGVRGNAGDLILQPKLLAEQFDADGHARISLTFAGKQFDVLYENRTRRDYGEYTITGACCDCVKLSVTDGTLCVLPRETLCGLSGEAHQITITLN